MLAEPAECQQDLNRAAAASCELDRIESYTGMPLVGTGTSTGSQSFMMVLLIRSNICKLIIKERWVIVEAELHCPLAIDISVFREIAHACV